LYFDIQPNPNVWLVWDLSINKNWTSVTQIIRNTWNTFSNSFLLTNLQWDRRKPNHSNNIIHTLMVRHKITEHFLNAFYFQIYKLFLKDWCTSTKKNSNNRHLSCALGSQKHWNKPTVLMKKLPKLPKHK
jgi:hypothetical protein